MTTLNDQNTPQISELIHDMRNKLAVARANIEAFIDGKLAPTNERLTGVVQTLRHLEQLIKDLEALPKDKTPPPSQESRGSQ